MCRCKLVILLTWLQFVGLQIERKCYILFRCSWPEWVQSIALSFQSFSIIDMFQATIHIPKVHAWDCQVYLSFDRSYILDTQCMHGLLQKEWEKNGRESDILKPNINNATHFKAFSRRGKQHYFTCGLSDRLFESWQTRRDRREVY